MKPLILCLAISLSAFGLAGTAAASTTAEIVPVKAKTVVEQPVLVKVRAEREIEVDMKSRMKCRDGKCLVVSNKTTTSSTPPEKDTE